jgi:hypothetical protein
MGISLVAKEMQAIMSAWKLLRCCMRCVTALYLIAKHPRAFTQQPPPASSKSRLIRRAAVTINTSNFHHFIRRLMSCSCAELRVAGRHVPRLYGATAVRQGDNGCHDTRKWFVPGRRYLGVHGSHQICLPTFQLSTSHVDKHVISFL